MFMTLSVLAFLIILITLPVSYGAVSLISFCYETKAADQAQRKTQSPNEANVTRMRNNERFSE